MYLYRWRESAIVLKPNSGARCHEGRDSRCLGIVFLSFHVVRRRFCAGRLNVGETPYLIQPLEVTKGCMGFGS